MTVIAMSQTVNKHPSVALTQLTSLGAPPLSGVQTVSVPPGGATVVDFKIDRPGRYTIVDHALSRLERGLVGSLIVDGPMDDEIMHQGPAKR
jgi:nitrite reductase (NO-forming)